MAKKILVIEDDRFLRKVIKKKFSGEGYIVIEATDGEKGIMMAKQENPDLILLDLVLPEIDGFKVLQELKWDQKTSKIPVIVFSNLGEKENIEKSFKIGADDYLIKANLDPSEILQRVKKIIGEK